MKMILIINNKEPCVVNMYKKYKIIKKWLLLI